MSKIFGYTKKGGKDWFSSDVYSDKEIEAIKDPEGGSEIHLPTAIPSPFARIDLVKTAFINIAKSPDLKKHTREGNVIAGKEDEKLVSECLDLAEMLFNIYSIRENIKIVAWDPQVELEKMKLSSPEHRRFAETLELYLDQDKKSYNFDRLDRLYLIKYNHRIIGCTSPVTLFFATANDLSHAQIKLTKNDTTFDQYYTPLYERDLEFQRYLYLLFKNPTLSRNMKEFEKYLEENLKILNSRNPGFFSEIKELKAEEFARRYVELNTGTSGDIVEVLGVPLRKRKRESMIDAFSSSDFMIQSTKPIEGLRPLVLQNNFNKPLRYANDDWNDSIKVPYRDNESALEKRWLPGVHIQYPYLTVSDFLEPYLIRLVYPINKDKFFEGNLVAEVGDDTKGYILPLKKQFFDYFTADDLRNSAPGKPTIKLIQGVANSVKVVLKIPVSKPDEYITFERMYFESANTQITKPDEDANKGVILEHEFGITLFPFLKTGLKDIKPFYRIQLVDRNIAGILKTTDYDLKFFSGSSNDPLSITAKKIRSEKTSGTGDPATSQYYVLHHEFDFIQVRDQGGSGVAGIVIPDWKPFNQGGETFRFAVDFGTTNTHVEYKVGTSSPKPFDITPNDVQIATLFHPTKSDLRAVGAVAISALIEHEFQPQHLGRDYEYKFPHRTVISESHSLNIKSETFTLADFNIPFIYEREIERDRIQSNLKWAKKESGNQKRVKAFLENIIMLLRNKVLLNKGNLHATELVWFYPSSMKRGRKGDLENMWNELFNDYFNPVKQSIGITESLAPFYYFKGANKIQGGAYKPVVSVDIGGGTTDIVVFKSNKPLLLTSFKFAANTIFGDGFSEFGAAHTNGFVTKYFPHYEGLLTANKLPDLANVLFSMKEKNRTEDVNAFFFSIENNPKIKDKELYSYNSLLAKDEDMKIIFLYFFASIIYHVAQLMKIKGVEMPKHLVFSGTGSKILNIITSDSRILADFSIKIFEGVYQQEYDSDGLTIETEKLMPKEVTCKGGLMSNLEELKINTDSIKTILTCLDGDGLDKLSLDKLNDETKASITEYVKKFNAFFLELNRELNFADHFNITSRSLGVFRNEVNKHLRDYLEEGLEFNRKLDEGSAEDQEIEETLFFYPIVGSINNLIGPLSQLSPISD